MLAIVLKLRKGNIAPAGIPSRLAAEDAHQFIGLGDWKRAKQQNVDDAKNSRVGANAQGQGQHGDQRETWTFAKHPRAIAQVLKNVFHHNVPPSFA